MAFNPLFLGPREIRFSLADKGKIEAISDRELHQILEDLGHVPVRATQYGERTEELRIAIALEDM